MEDLTVALRESVGALGSQLRLRFAGEGGPGFVALATLRHLRRHGPRTVGALAATDRVTTQAVSLRIRPLEEAGLVERVRDEQDARRTWVRPTPAGLAVVDAAERRAGDALARAVDALPPADRAALEGAVPVLAALAEALAEEAG